MHKEKAMGGINGSKKRSPILPAGIGMALVLFALAAGPTANAATYEVGPGKAYASIGAVPWASLLPGDTVLIYWRSTPYKE